MRILVADRNALLLAAINATFGPHCDLVTATRRDVCLTQVEQYKFDVVIACDKLSDYTGLELLSEIGAISPDTLLIFAANPNRLNQLGKRLAVFGLFEVLSYPLTPRKLLDALKRARQSLRTASKPKVRHVVLESEWDTGVRLGLVEKDLEAQAEAAGRAGRAEHDNWPEGAQVTAGGAPEPGVGADDFVFSGPPVVSPVSDPVAPPRAESRARTFEATPVIPRVTADAGEMTEYEVKPLVLALPHDSDTIACDDEFIFASSESVPVSVSVEPAGGPVAQEAEPSIEDFCSNDPIFDVPEPPRWAEDGAANDTAYEAKPAAHGRDTETAAAYSSGSRVGHASNGSRHADANGSQASDGTSSPQAKPPQGKPSEAGKAGGKVTQAAPSPKAPTESRTRARRQSVPTDAQRAAFERAVARRNAALGVATAAPAIGKVRKSVKGGVKTEPTIQAGSMDSLFAGATAPERPSKSLSEWAKIAAHKRPLPTRPKKRAVYAVGSGLAAVLILGAISFELLRSSKEAEHHISHGAATSTQLFSSRTMMLDNNEGSGVPQFGPPIQQAAVSQTVPQDAPPPNEPEAQAFDPNTAPEDPPPPPALENPGPMEPPSDDVHTGPPLGMIQGTDGSTDSE